MITKIYTNRAQCRKCLDIIESKYRHNFVICKCGAISVDSGKDYLKRSGMELDDVIELSEYDSEYNDKNDYFEDEDKDENGGDYD